MRLSDAKEILTKEGDGWEMPDEWIEVYTGDQSYRLSRRVFQSLYKAALVTVNKMWEGEDVYGSKIGILIKSITGWWEVTSIIRARYMIGREKYVVEEDRPDWEP